WWNVIHRDMAGIIGTFIRLERKVVFAQRAAIFVSLVLKPMVRQRRRILVHSGPASCQMVDIFVALHPVGVASDRPIEFLPKSVHQKHSPRRNCGWTSVSSPRSFFLLRPKFVERLSAPLGSIQNRFAPAADVDTAFN